MVELNQLGKKQLTNGERDLVLKLHCALASGGDTVNKAVSDAFGIKDPKTLQKWTTEAKERSSVMVTTRKKNKSAGLTIFNSDAIRKSVFTTRSVFEKIYRHEHKDQRFTQAETKEAHDQVKDDPTSSIMLRSAQLAQQQLQQSALLAAAAKDALLKTKGSVAWRELAQQASGAGGMLIANKDTFHKCVMSLPNSSCQKSCVFPHINERTKLIRHKWSNKAFWIFWEMAKLAAPKVQMLLIHMDEKWFFAIVARKHNKRAPHFGVFPSHL